MDSEVARNSTREDFLRICKSLYAYYEGRYAQEKEVGLMLKEEVEIFEKWKVQLDALQEKVKNFDFVRVLLLEYHIASYSSAASIRNFH